VRRKVERGKLRVESRNITRRGSASQLSTLNSQLRRVRLLLTDVDGVMTDGSVFIASDGEFKQFNIQDGLGLVLLRKCGIKVGWISARPSMITTKRAEELQIDYLSQEKESKVAAAENILAKEGLNWAQVCFVGDDVVDLCLLKRAGVAVAVANAIPEAKAMAHYVTEARGGHGAVREVVTIILEAQGKWTEVVRRFTT
jgi:3-deoxy-D-manno-octulosonate 8-phosphate phosphatase (KDO 8-P phosphatase)